MKKMKIILKYLDETKKDYNYYKRKNSKLTLKNIEKKDNSVSCMKMFNIINNK